MSQYQRTIRYTSKLGGIKGLNLLTNIVRNKLVALILGPSGIGLISIYTNLMTLFNNLSHFGVSTSAIRRLSEAQDPQSPEFRHWVMVLRRLSIMLGVVGMALCCIISPWLASYVVGDSDATWSICLLSPMILFLGLVSCETAVLTSCRQLKSLLRTTFLTTFVTLVISVPIYYCWGYSGIVYSLFLCSLMGWLITFFYSHRAVPFEWGDSTLYSTWLEGKSLFKVGVAFTIVGVLNSQVEVLVRTYMAHVSSSSWTEVGYYNAGYALVITYSMLVYSALDLEFYPRLSSVNTSYRKMQYYVNQQVSITASLVSPLLIVFQVSLPILLPLLYSRDFTPVISMAQVAVFCLYFRSMSLPFEYVSLAKGHSLVYLGLESAYLVVLAVGLMWGYSLGGLWGTGISLVITAIFNFLEVLIFVGGYYHIQLSLRNYLLGFLQMALGAGVYLLHAFCGYTMPFYCGSAFLLALSAYYSYKTLKR